MRKPSALIVLVTVLCMLFATPIQVFAQAAAEPAATEAATTAPAADAAPAAAPSSEGTFNVAAYSKDVTPLTDEEVRTALRLTATWSNNAWLIVATALVFFMTIPGLALFYGGLAKRKNVLSIIMQSFASMAVVSVVWVGWGFSLAFSDGELIPGLLGDFKYAFLNGISTASTGMGFYISQPNAPVNDLVFVMFQCMFAVITPALIIGAYSERFKFGHFIVFTIAWITIVYAPIAHSVWNIKGWLFAKGALDFAGGTVVHINAGVAGLVGALILGKRSNTKPNPPHNLVFTVVGAAMLWFGWFGFNAGSGLAADGIAGNAFMVTNTATAVAAIIWVVMDWIFHKKPTVLGAATGAVAGLVAITPASGFVDVWGSIVIGIVVSVVCWFMVVVVKSKLKYDDALDCFGVHAIGGMVGAILVGVLANAAVWQGFGHGPNDPVPFAGGGAQLVTQLTAVGFAIAWTGIGSAILFGILKFFRGKASAKEQAVGLDIVEHGERAYTVIE